MKVKYAREVLSEETARAIERRDFPFTLFETEQTRQYIRMCNKLFTIMNATTLLATYMKELITVLRWFTSWFQEIEEEATQPQNRGHAWVQFIYRSIYRSMHRSIYRSLLGRYLTDTRPILNRYSTDTRPMLDRG